MPNLSREHFTNFDAVNSQDWHAIQVKRMVCLLESLVHEGLLKDHGPNIRLGETIHGDAQKQEEWVSESAEFRIWGI